MKIYLSNNMIKQLLDNTYTIKEFLPGNSLRNLEYGLVTLCIGGGMDTALF